MIANNTSTYKFGLRQAYILACLVMLLSGAAIIDMGSESRPLSSAVLNLRYLAVLVSLVLISILKPKATPVKPTLTLKALILPCLWILFSLAALASSLYHSDQIGIRDNIWFLLGVPLIFFYRLPTVIGEDMNLLLSIALPLAHAPYILASLLLQPPSLASAYQGVFSNPNQMGQIAIVIAIGLFALLNGGIKSGKSFFYLLFIGVFIIITLGLIMVANARTSLAVFAIMTLFVFLNIGATLVSKPSSLFRTIVSALLGFSLVTFYAGGELAGFLTGVGGGFAAKSALSGRDAIWSKAIADMSLLGHGNEYFSSNFGLGAHNTIIDILGRNGLIAAEIMTVFAFTSLYLAYQHFCQSSKQNPYTIVLFLITSCFWILSIGEGLFGSLGKSITIAYFLVIGMITYQLSLTTPKLQSRRLYESRS
jgi:O-antigen ligase